MSIHKQPCSYQHSFGLSLVELMVSLSIGAVILSGAVVVYMDQLQSSRRLTAYAQLQESGRVALDIIERDIRMSGFSGCLTAKAVFNNALDGAPSTFQPEKGIQGWEANNSKPGDNLSNVLYTTAVVNTNSGWATSGGNVLGSFSAIPNSDIIRTWGGSEFDLPVISFSVSAPYAVKTPAADIADDDILLISDCENIDIVQACGVATSANVSTLSLSSSCSPGTSTSKPIKSAVSPNARVTKLRGTTYVVSKHNDIALNPPSLFRAELDLNGATVGNFVEVVQGVESMQILYGENTNGDAKNSADAYVTANNVSQWENVVSVRVSLLMQSVDDNLIDGFAPYQYNGVTYDGSSLNATPADSRLRRVFSRTITLRNRTLGI